MGRVRPPSQGPSAVRAPPSDDGRATLSLTCSAIYKKFNSESQARAFIEEKTGGPLASTSAPVGQATSQRQTRVDRPTTVRAKRADSPSYSAKVTRRSASPDDRRGDTRARSREPDEISRLRSKGYRFTNAKPYHLVVYTDGSGLGNGQKGARAGCGVWWGSEGEALQANLTERVPGEAQTNNRGEILVRDSCNAHHRGDRRRQFGADDLFRL